MLAKVQDFSEADLCFQSVTLWKPVFGVPARGLRMDRQAGESCEFTPDSGGSDLEMVKHLFACIPKVRLRDLATLSGGGGSTCS